MILKSGTPDAGGVLSVRIPSEAGEGVQGMGTCGKSWANAASPRAAQRATIFRNTNGRHLRDRLTHHQDLFCYFRFEPLLLYGLQAHFLVNLFEPLLHVLEPLEFR
jgi:hypothetical protein